MGKQSRTRAVTSCGAVSLESPTPVPLSHQFIADVTLEKREVGPHPSQTLSINTGADGADARLRPRVGGGWTRMVHSPPRTVALASSGRGRSQLTDVLLATSRTPWSPLPPQGPAGPLPLGAGSSGPSMAGGGLTAKGSACQAGLCGESRGQGSAAVLASLGGRDQRGCCPRVRAQEASGPLPCLAGSQAPPRAGPPPRTAQCHPEQTPSGVRAYICFQLEGPVGSGVPVLAHHRPEETAQNLVGRGCLEPFHECLDRDTTMNMWKQGTEQLCSWDTPGPRGVGVSPPCLLPGEGWDGQTATPGDGTLPMGLSGAVTPALVSRGSCCSLSLIPRLGGSTTKRGLHPAEPLEGTQEMGRVQGCPQDRRQRAAEGREGGNGQGGTRDCSPRPGALGPSPGSGSSREGDFPSGAVAKTPLSQCRRLRSNPWSGNEMPQAAT